MRDVKLEYANAWRERALEAERNFSKLMFVSENMLLALEGKAVNEFAASFEPVRRCIDMYYLANPSLDIKPIKAEDVK